MKNVLFLILLPLFIAGCSKESPDDIMKMAKENIEQQKYSEAVPMLEKLLTDFPDSEVAPKALFNLATIYQNKLAGKLTEKESLKKAASLFKELFDKYPKSSEAGTSLFMAAFITANEPVLEYKEATELYTLFLDKFPDHDFAKDAKVELQIMGMPIDQLIRKDL